MNLRPPLFAFFVLVTCFAVLTIVALVLWLDTFQADAARRAADSAVRGALLHGAEVVSEPLRAIQLIAKQAAMMANTTKDFCDDGRTNPAAMIPLNQQNLAAARANPAAYYVYQSFTHHGHWTYCGCGKDECVFAANGSQYGLPGDFPEVHTSWTEVWDDESFDDADYVKNIKSLTFADTEGSFDPFEIFEADGLLGGIQIPLKFAPNGTCIMAQGADVRSKDMRATLLQLSLPQTVVALIDTDRKLLLATTADIGLPIDAQWLNDTAGNPRLMGIGEIPNVAMRDAVARVAPMMATQRKPSVLDSDGKDIVGIAPVIVLNSRLTIVTVTERDFFYSTLADTRRSAAIIGSVGAALCVLVSAVVCLLVSVALHRLRAAMVPAAKLRLSPEELEAAGRSVVRDVAALQDAFAEMNARLHEAGAYIPHALRVAWSEEDGSVEPEEVIDVLDELTTDVDLDELQRSAIISPTSGSIGDMQSSGGGRRNPKRVTSILAPEPGGGGGGRRRRSTARLSLSEISTPSNPTMATVTTPTMRLTRKGTFRGLATKLLRSTSTVRATLLSINLRGFSEHTSSKIPAEVCAVADAFAGIVYDAAVKHRGVLDSFQGDRFLVTFNASSNAAVHATKAAMCANEIHSAVSGGAIEALGKNVTVSCGTATSLMVVGDIGCKEMKRFGLIGHAFTRALALERLCCSYGPTEYCAVAAAAFEELSAHFVVTPVDFVKLPGCAAPSSVGVLGKKLEGAADEWLYVVGQGPAHATEGPAAVLDHFSSGNYEAALRLWDSVQHIAPETEIERLMFRNVKAIADQMQYDTVLSSAEAAAARQITCGHERIDVQPIVAAACAPPEIQQADLDGGLSITDTDDRRDVGSAVLENYNGDATAIAANLPM